MLYAYQKATPDNPAPGRLIPPYLRFFPTLISALGLGLVTSVIWPIISYQLASSGLIETISSQSSLLSPALYESYADTSSGPIILSDIDYSRAGNWFAGSADYSYPLASLSADTVKNYSLSIPSLNIEIANVDMASDDLAKNLVHYPQTALPGQSGSPVIFGHSTLPQFFDPTNYSTIFSTLPKIQIGSDIIVDFGGVKYTYRVTKMYEVKPTDLWVLRQEYNQKSLKLITCVPPGTKIRRLVVEASLIKL